MSDRRNCKPAAEPSIEVDGELILLPYKWGICSVCDGEGNYVNPSIDSHGISAEEMNEDPDFRESYFRGDYDVTCNCCGGRGSVKVADESKMTTKQLSAWNDLQTENAYDAAFDRMCEMERLMGA